MSDALLAGFLVGLSVAVFVGGAAMTVMETAIQRGPRVALAAGAGVATGDAVWAGVAAGAGLALSRLLAPWAAALQWTAVLALSVLLLLGLRELVRPEPPVADVGLARSPLRGYAEFLTHTLRHSTTVAFFVSLIVGAAPRYGAATAVAFVAGVFLASLSWQWLLVIAGARRGRSFSGRTRRVVLGLDCGLLALFIGYLALGLYRS